MKRLLIRLPLALSCILFVAIAILAIKSFFQTDSLAWARTKEHHLESRHGHIDYWTAVEYRSFPISPPGYFPPKWFFDGTDHDSRPFPAWPVYAHESQRNWGFDAPPVWSHLGISYSKLAEPGPPATAELSTHLLIPYWIPLVVTGFWPFFSIARQLRSKLRKRPGLCARCSYDLRAHASGDRCPECGTPVPPMSA